MSPLDTSPGARDLQFDILGKMSGIERLRIAIDLSEFARKLALARIEREHPGLTEHQLIQELLHCVLSRDDYPPSLA